MSDVSEWLSMLMKPGRDGEVRWRRPPGGPCAPLEIAARHDAVAVDAEVLDLAAAPVPS